MGEFSTRNLTQKKTYIMKNRHIGTVSICQALKDHKLIEFTLTVLNPRETLPSVACNFQGRANREGLEGDGHVQKEFEPWGSWVAQLVECLTSAHVMISQFVSLSPASGSLLSAQSPLQILCSPPLSASPPLVLTCL